MQKKSPKEKAGVVAYRCEEGIEPVVLVVSARKYENQWVFPVGSVEKGESLEKAAKRECEEESGYLVDIVDRLLSIEASGDGHAKRFTFFLATVVGETDGWETDRQRKWLPASTVAEALPGIFQGVARQAIERIMERHQR